MSDRINRNNNIGIAYENFGDIAPAQKATEYYNSALEAYTIACKVSSENQDICKNKKRLETKIIH